MGGSFEAFKLFNALSKGRASDAQTTPSTATTSSTTPVESSDTTPASSTVEITPQANSENGFKLCLGNTMDYSRREQNLREVQKRLEERSQQQ